MSDVQLPDLKFKLWTMLREDLVQYVPAFEDADTLLCPICCRPLRYEQFSLEHILPQQAMKLDPTDVRNAIIKNERSGLTLLCSETLIVGNKSYAKGCNGWKGRNFDPHISDLLKRGPFSIQFADTHIIALLVVGYLGLFKQYGYRVALTDSSLVLRNQFFNPRRFTKHLPLKSQMVLSGDPHTQYGPETHAYWSDPVKVYVDATKATIAIRNYSVILSLSYDPTIPLARTLAYAPRKHVFRPDLRLAFQ
ncbi:MAG: hypothetical protein E5V60_04490 [Mesorhizobium sp.]|nr:MAG: hypothetical protein E5V60_04490 [Mesorhizobium sp.]